MSTPNSAPPYHTQKVSSKASEERGDTTSWLYDFLLGLLFGYVLVGVVAGVINVFAR